jgi:membrane protein DedA with SNARE-associated domain
MRATYGVMLDWMQEALGDGGYLVLTALILLENLFPPVPSEVLLPLAGSRISAGDWSFPLVLLAASAGSLIGALVLYALGRTGGRALLLRHGNLLRLDERRLDRADDWFDRHGPKVVFFGRLLPGVRSVVSVPAGASEMPVGRFLFYTGAGSVVWNAALIGAGWALGTRWDEVTAVVEQAQWPVLGAAAIAVPAAILASRALARRRRPRTA